MSSVRLKYHQHPVLVINCMERFDIRVGEYFNALAIVVKRKTNEGNERKPTRTKAIGRE